MTEKDYDEDLDPVHEAIERFNQAQDAYSRQRQDAREDLRFVAGDQWSDSTQSDELHLTVNLLNPFLRQITAEARSANPAIKVIPMGGGADVALAEARQGLIRNIEQQSDAESIYQNALWYAAAGGEGYIFIDSEYCSDDSFDQDLILKNCENPEKVFLDPHHVKVDGTDADWGFIIEDISHDALKRKFPKSKLAEGLGTLGWNRLSLPGDWIDAETCRVAKYYVKERIPKKIWLVMDPLTMEQSTTDEEPGDTLVVLNSRTSFDTEVKCYLMDGIEILEETTWPGKHIPIIKVTGDNFYVGGERVQYGAVRHAKDPQRQYNYHTSRQTEMIDLAPKNSFVGATGQFSNNPEKWANANRVNYGFLDYTPVSLVGHPVPPPTRVSGLDLSAFQGVAASRAQSLEDLKLVFGLHDAALGRVQGEASGVALQQRTEQSSRSTYHYFDNLLIALKAVGRQLNELIPFFYDTDRIVRIVKPTDEEQMIAINSISNKNRYDMTKGDYSVIISTGPAYSSKRQEAFEALNGIMAALPESGRVISDLVAGQIDSPVAQQAAARLKATVPPEVLAATGEDDNEDAVPAELLAKAKQDLAMNQQKVKHLELEKQEMQVQIKIASDKSALDLTIADMKHDEVMRRITLDEQIAMSEMQLKTQEHALAERQIELKEKELQMNATVAAHNITSKEHADFVKTNETHISKDSNLGGSIG